MTYRCRGKSINEIFHSERIIRAIIEVALLDTGEVAGFRIISL